MYEVGFSWGASRLFSSTAHLSFGLGAISLVLYLFLLHPGDPCFSFFYSWGNEEMKEVG